METKLATSSVYIGVCCLSCHGPFDPFDPFVSSKSVALQAHGTVLLPSVPGRITRMPGGPTSSAEQLALGQGQLGGTWVATTNGRGRVPLWLQRCECSMLPDDRCRAVPF